MFKKNPEFFTHLMLMLDGTEITKELVGETTTYEGAKRLIGSKMLARRQHRLG